MWAQPVCGPSGLKPLSAERCFYFEIRPKSQPKAPDRGHHNMAAALLTQPCFLDADVHPTGTDDCDHEAPCVAGMASEFGVRGYPTIKL